MRPTETIHFATQVDRRLRLDFMCPKFLFYKTAEEIHIFMYFSFQWLVHTNILEWITIRFLMYSIGNSAQYYMAGWMGGKFEGEWIYVHILLSRSAMHLRSSHC